MYLFVKHYESQNVSLWEDQGGNVAKFLCYARVVDLNKANLTKGQVIDHFSHVLLSEYSGGKVIYEAPNLVDAQKQIVLLAIGD